MPTNHRRSGAWRVELEILPRVGHTINLECIPDHIQLLDSFAAKVVQAV